MRRRFRDRSRSCRQSLDLLQHAHSQMEAADHSAAAGSFEQLAAQTRARDGHHRGVLLLEAGRARILAGQVDQGREDLKSGLEVLAERGRWARFQRAGERALTELRKRSLRAEAQDSQAFLEARLPEGFDLAMAPGLRKRPLLPTHCPSCGGPIETDMVEWLDDSTAECDYCGSPVRAQE